MRAQTKSLWYKRASCVSPKEMLLTTYVDGFDSTGTGFAFKVERSVHVDQKSFRARCMHFLYCTPYVLGFYDFVEFDLSILNDLKCEAFDRVAIFIVV